MTTYEVRYEAVLEYDEENLPHDPEFVMHDLLRREPDFGETTVVPVEGNDDE